MKSVRCITINTDASYHSELKVGGYAFTIVCDLFRINKSGRFKTPPKSSQDAEIMCIGNAIHTLLTQPELPNTQYLIVNTDCKWGYRAILESKKSRAKSVRALWEQLIEEVGSHKSEFRHVRAHTGANDRRSKANHWCDQEARKQMHNAVMILNPKTVTRDE